MKNIFKRIKFHIKASDTTSIEEIFTVIQTIWEKYPNAEICVDIDRM